MPTRHWAANNLAARLLAGPWTLEAIGTAIDTVLGPQPAREDLIADLAALAQNTYPPTPQALTAHLVQSDHFKPHPGRAIPAVLDPPRSAPTPSFAGLPIPALTTPGDLAAWLCQSPEQLDWLADQRRHHGRATRPPFPHYHYAFASKRNGKPRLIEAPKPRLKAIQRRILHEILAAVPTHPRAHGFVAGRSCLTGARVHAGEAMVATYDLTQFFPSIALPRIHGIFRTLGYPWAVARRLAGLCTTVTPAGVFPDPHRPEHALYRMPHLPQGAPTSPALANLLAWTLDRRLDGLARTVEANYSRYADDLAFSGNEAFAARIDRFGRTIETILHEEGFTLNTAKTRIMPRGTRQRVTGIVVNEHCNTGRTEFDTLKAILHNCTRTGPSAQNHADIADFRAHLDGRITWVEQVNFPRGLKLRRLFDRIDWTSTRPPPR